MDLSGGLGTEVKHKNLVSKSALQLMTGKHYATITKKLALIEPVKVGCALKSNSVEALPIIYDIVDGQGQLPTSKSYSLQDERARLAHHQANNQKLKEDEQKGLLVLMTEVLTVWGWVIGVFKTKMMAISSTAVHELAMIDDPEETKDVLDGYIREALEELNNMSITYETTLDSGLEGE